MSPDRLDNLEEAVARLYELLVSVATDLETLTQEDATAEVKAQSRSRIADVVRLYEQHVAECEGSDDNSQLSFAFVHDTKHYLS